MGRTSARPAVLQIKRLQERVLRFYRAARRDLPWRHTRDPYRILVSEVMLQQTQTDRVIPKYETFLGQFPTIVALARARFAHVLKAWLGLGYNGRALRLWQCARTIVREHRGLVPSDPDELEQLPGIGPYTASAVASFAFGAALPIVDTNVHRVLVRTLLGRNAASQTQVTALARQALVPAQAAQWAQALMDVGALFCRARPRCERCPIRPACAFARKNRPLLRRQSRSTTPFAGSNRFYRGRIVRLLSERASVAISEVGRQVREDFSARHAAWLNRLLEALSRDGLIVFDLERKRVRLP
jgi:A/G-specific adenine glycosylase